MTGDFIRRNSQSVKWDLAGPDVLPMWVADMDIPVDRGIIEAISSRLEHPFMGYSLLPDEYFDAFITWVAVHQGWDVRREWLTYSPSVMAGLRLALEQFSAEGEGVIVPSPVYYPFFSAVKDKGRRLDDLPLDFDGKRQLWTFDFDRLAELAADPNTRLLLLCNPHNPIGRVWSAEELKTLVDICAQNRVFIISDEIHADIIYQPNTFTPLVPLLRESGAQELGIAIQAPSKTFNIPGLLSSHIISPDSGVRKLLEKAVAAAGLELPNVLAVTASQQAYSASRPWLDATLRVLEGNRNRLEDFLKGVLPDSSWQMTPEGTYLYWIDLRSVIHRKGMDGKTAYASLKREAGLWLSPGYLFSPTADGFFRLNFACPGELLEEGISRLAGWIT